MVEVVRHSYRLPREVVECPSMELFRAWMAVSMIDLIQL